MGEAEPGKVKTYLKPPQKGRDQFVNLQQRNIPSNTRPRPGPKLEHRTLHILQLFFTRFEPPLRSEHVDILSEDFRTPMQDPSVTSHNRTAGNMMTQNIDSRRGRSALKHQPSGRMKTERFLHNSIQIRQCLRTLPSNNLTTLLRNQALPHRPPQLPHQLIITPPIPQKMIENRTQTNRRRLAPGKHHTQTTRQDQIIRHEIRVFELRLREFGEEVYAPGCLGLGV